MIKDKKEFDDKVFRKNQEKDKEQRIRYLEKQLQKLKQAA
jgi:hypothetical protein